ncbi:MAG: polysaccharide biosynthesis tyrosine autokinase [Geminicoccaceae bacterium]|nr:polysaccharide biosynthesis tyrosine autokinase [Geminicoccaceae bacterium]
MSQSPHYPGQVEVKAVTRSSPGDGLDASELIAVIKRRRWAIVSTIVLLTTLSTLIGLQLTPRYTATALVMIDPRESKVVDVEAVMQGMGADAASVETQIKVLGSRSHMEAVMRSLHLFEDPEFNPRLTDTGRTVKLADAGPLRPWLSILPDGLLLSLGLAREQLADDAYRDQQLQVETAIDTFSDQLAVRQDGRSHVIAIEFTSVNPAKASRIANEVADLYVRREFDARLAATSKATGWLATRLRSLRDELEKSEAAVESYRASEGLVDTGAGRLREQELSELSRTLMTARADLSDKRARLELIRELRARGEGLDTVAEVLQSGTIMNLRQQESDLLREEAELRTYFGEKHPRIQNLVAEKANLQAKIATEVERIIKNLGNEVNVIASRVADTERQLADLSGVNDDERARQVHLRELEREADSSRQLYESFLQRYKETREQQGIIENDVRVISRAAPPEQPSSPGPKIFAAAGFGSSVMIGLMLALLFERLDNGLRSTRQVEEELGLAALGLVPGIKGLRRGEYPHQYLIKKPLSAYAEAMRAIYTSMQLSDVDSPPKVVMVTSALPQEGKTTLSLSLATFAARSAQRVILVDLDLRHPSVHRDLPLEPEAGFVEVMAGERKLSEVILHDEESGIDILPVRRQTANPTDILSSRRMRRLISVLRSHYDYVVIDSAPLLGVTDSKIVALLVDKVIFATQWEKTRIEAARNGLAHLREINASVAGSVLTQVNVRKHAYYGYGDVGQYYGKYQRYYVN